jgi:hypothetical protein
MLAKKIRAAAVCLAAVLMLTGCGAGRSSGSESSGGSTVKTIENVTIKADIEKIPDGYSDTADEGGKLVDVNYKSWDSLYYEDKKTRIRKHAVVYLPHGYSKSKKYDIFYLMHGGWSDENSTLGTPDSPGEFKNVLDNAIENGDIRPIIVVCPTYNNTNEGGRDSDDFSLALTLTDNYHRELLNDLMPAVEGKYSTYAEDTTKSGFEASRDHRGFGGFSMGSVATWHTFQYDLDYFRYFLPMSCGTGLDDGSIWKAADGRDPSDYFVFVMTGTDDFAYSYDRSRTKAMASSKYFKSVDEGKDGNFAFRVKKGYEHDGTAAMEYTFNGLKAFFKA